MILQRRVFVSLSFERVWSLATGAFPGDGWSVDDCAIFWCGQGAVHFDLHDLRCTFLMVSKQHRGREERESVIYAITYSAHNACLAPFLVC